MDFSTTPEQDLLRKTAREFVDKEISPHVDAWEDSGQIPDEVVRKLGRLVILGAPIPVEYGGAGLDAVSYAMLTEEIARGCSSLRTTISVNTSLFGQTVNIFGSDAQKRLWLPAICTGEKRGAWALTEHHSGSDAAGLRTSARRDGEHWVLDGTKMWISDGDRADHVVVFARVNTWDPKRKREGISVFVVDKGTPGFKIGSVEVNKKLGLRASHSAELIFEGCRVPLANLVGREGQGWDIANAILQKGRLSVAAGAIGIAQRAFELALDYAKRREAFGQAIGRFQLVQEHLAYMAIDVETSRLLVLRAAWLGDQGLDNSLAVSMAKLHAAEACMRVTERAVQIHGGNGYSAEYVVERLFRDAKICGIYEGTNEIQKVIIGGKLTGAR